MAVTCVNVLKTMSKRKRMLLAMHNAQLHQVENERLIRKVRG
jgi:hypothetical protein